MPIFGNRVVVGTADYRHIKEFKDGMNQREEALAQWSEEKQKRKEQLEILQTRIDASRRNSLNSQKSNDDIAPQQQQQQELELEDSIEKTEPQPDVLTVESVEEAKMAKTQPEVVKTEQNSRLCSAGNCALQ